MGRRGRTGDSKYVVILQTLRGSVATAELGKIAKEALLSGWDLKTLARAVGVNHVTVMKWLKAAEGVGNNSSSKRGRPSELDESHAAVLRQLASNPAFAHLPAKAVWELYLKHFECSPECQANSCPHETVSYYTAWRFLQTLPQAYRLGRMQLKRRFRASHPSLIPPGTIWVADRSKSDLMLLKDEKTQKWGRYELAAIIDQGTMTILAIGAVEREGDGRSSQYFDTASFNALFADALLGDLTGVSGKPKALLIDWGKVENNKALQEVCKKLRIQIVRARPYDPGSKPQVEALFNFVHHKLEAICPGYLGSLNRPDNRPPTTESGKLKKCIDPRTGEVYWGDDSGRKALSVREFNQIVKEWAREWNLRECGTWNGIRLELFQQGVKREEYDEEILRIKLLPSFVRKARTDGEVFVGSYRFWHYGTAVMAYLGDKRPVDIYLAPDFRAWVFLNGEPLGGSLEAAKAIEVPTWRYLEGSETVECWTEFKRRMARLIKEVGEQGRKEGLSVEEIIWKYKDMLLAEYEKFIQNPRSFMPYRKPEPLEDESPKMSLEEELELLHEIGNYLEQETRAQREKVWQRNQPRFEGWIWENEEEEAINDAPSSNSAV